jgi:SAM-dependent methyltransferase
MQQSFQSHLEEPAAGVPIENAEFRCRGWFSAPAGAQFSSASLVIDGERFPLLLTPRDDVQRAFPESATTGFTGLCPAMVIENARTQNLAVNVDGTVVSIPLMLSVNRNALARFAELKRAKLEKLRPLLICPHCREQTFTEFPEELVCASCESRFPRDCNAFDFLSKALREGARVQSTANVSANAYNADAMADIDAQIARDPEFLVLDAGSGFRSDYHANIVNFEIAKYQSTDVLGVCEALPFADESFDAVFSFAVLEHVRDPFKAARELTRVLKPGGNLYVVVPFLQPFHGYPNHYYNMTSAGLQNLFPDLDVLRCDVPEYARPIYGLAWIVGSWLRSLPPTEAAAFREMRIADLLADASCYACSPFVTALSEAANEELACANRLFAKKPLKER